VTPIFFPIVLLIATTANISFGNEIESAANFSAAVEALSKHTGEVADAVSEVVKANREIEQVSQQITSKRQEAQKLQQEAQQAMAQANMLNNLSANQGAGPGGGGGGGGGSGGSGSGSKGLQLKAPELPEMPEAAAFELPSPQPGVDLGDIASSLSFNSRGAVSSPMDNPIPPFTGFNLPAAAKSPKPVSPGSVAAGNLPELSGNKTAGTPIGPSQSGAAGGGAAGGGGGGGGGAPGGFGGGGGGMGGGGMGGGGDDVMASVGSEPSYSEGGLRVQTQQMGDSGGEGGAAGSSESAGGGPDESAVRAQISRGVAGTPSSKEKNPNPEGKGLMAYVGFIQSTCRKAKETLEVCKGPMLSADKARLAAMPRVEALRDVAPARTIASPPAQESYGPVRAGLLGLVSGK
jgi:hypothetical protein